ncbi:MAG: DUF434 domain-containing protein [Thaumarchaeota archaeon]|nr:DUF434 domain-containing protein [Nitrososphaerota archaeon]
MEARIKVLREARLDLKYLLNRGYRKSSALKLVGDKYQLNRAERSILFRSVLSDDEASVIRSKMASLEDLKGEELWIDGFNVLNTIETVLRGEVLVLCDDGVLRDFSEIHSKYRLSDLTGKALEEITSLLRKAETGYVVFLFESQISRSGEIAALARKILEAEKVPGEARTTKSVDSALIKSGKLVASSDSTILLKCKRFIDLARYLDALDESKIISLA